MKKLLFVSCTILVVIVLPCILLYHYGSHNYLDKFFSEQMIPLMGTIMALNFAIATSLQTMLYSIEQTNKDHSKKSSYQSVDIACRIYYSDLCIPAFACLFGIPESSSDTYLFLRVYLRKQDRNAFGTRLGNAYGPFLYGPLRFLLPYFYLYRIF